MKNSPTYNAWAHMKQRCLNPNCQDWPDYGGRGITVCDQWLDSFETFLADVGVKPDALMLDRINNDGNYEPGNVKWSTPKEQAQNKRNNLWATAFGETKVARDWALDPRCAVSQTSLRRRLKLGRLSPEEAIASPRRDRAASGTYRGVTATTPRSTP